MSGVRSCPLLSVVHHSAADPARTEDPVPSGRGRLRRSGLRDQGPIGRPGTVRPMQASSGLDSDAGRGRFSTDADPGLSKFVQELLSPADLDA
jgi:hypothetical protein